MERSYGTSQQDRLIPALLPESVKIDGRELVDLLAYMTEFAANIRFKDPSDQWDGTKYWDHFLQSDHSVALAAILHLDIQRLDERRVAIAEKIARAEDGAGREKHLREFIGLIEGINREFESWQDCMKRMKRGLFSQVHEVEHEIDFLVREKFPPYVEELNRWKNQTTSFSGKDEKNIVQNYLAFYNGLVRLKSIAARHFPDTLLRADHAPPTGLLLAFLQLFRHPLQQLDGLTERHLNYYYRQVLGMEPRPAIPDEAFVCFEPGELSDATYLLRQGTRLTGEKDEDGLAPSFRTADDLHLSRARIASLKTVFLSKDPEVNIGSTYRLITNIYAAPVADSADGLGAPLPPGKYAPWPPFGESQLHKAPSERTMVKADIGLIIGSPVLLLQNGERNIRVRFQFREKSMLPFRQLVQDLCLRLGLEFLEVFYQVFQDSFRLYVSAGTGWAEIYQYEVVPPADMSDTTWELRFSLSPSDPAIVENNPELHLAGFDCPAPLLKITLGGPGPYYPYSFLRDLELERIVIDTEVSHVKNLDLYNNLGKIDSSLPFQPFGPLPILGSYLIIGYPEVFRKQVTGLSFQLDWMNLPRGEEGFAAHYSAYGLPWSNDTFQVELSALQHNRFYPLPGAPPLRRPLFSEAAGAGGRLSPVTTWEVPEVDRLNMHPFYKLEPVLQFDQNTRSGFFKMELTAPVEAFGHELFPRLFTEAITANALAQTKRRPGKPLPLPSEPYTPVLRGISLSYTATDSISLGVLEAENRNPVAPEYLYHVHPFGIREVYARGRVLNTRLVPFLNEDGYLCIGLADLRPPQPLTLYFELAGSALGSTRFEGPEVTWSYLSNNEWKPFSREQILADGIGAFTRSGIVALDLPGDLNRNHTILPADLHWIRVALRGNAALAGTVRMVRAHAVRAVRVSGEGDPFREPDLPPGTLYALENDLPQVRGAAQPFPSFGGQPAESAQAFYTRVSERLRHKGRGITAEGIERLVLDAFPHINQVKCLGRFAAAGDDAGGPPGEPANATAPGRLIVVVIPKVDKYNETLEPGVNIHLLTEIQAYLRDRVSPFIELELRNPAYEKIKVNCEVVFTAGSNSGQFIQQLNRDLNAYLAPWAYGKNTKVRLGGAISKEAILQFIEQRPYVRFVTGFSVLHIYTVREDVHLVRDTAAPEERSSMIRPSVPWAVLTPFPRHQISFRDEEQYQPPEPSALENIAIGVDFIVRDEEEENRRTEGTQPRASRSAKKARSKEGPSYRPDDDFNLDDLLKAWRGEE